MRETGESSPDCQTWTLIISAGCGPTEVREFVALLRSALVDKIISHTMIVHSTTYHGGEAQPRSIEIELEGQPIASLKENLGTHVLVARSTHRSRRSRKRWFAGVSLHEAAATPTSDHIPTSDVEITTTRSGGPGGQHVNTTDSAVRIRHLPTGISIRVSSQRSQHQNKSQALRRLAAVLAASHRGKRADHKQGIRSSHYQFERGSAVRQWSIDSKTGTLIPKE